MKKALLASMLLVMALAPGVWAQTVPYGLVQAWYTYASFDEAAVYDGDDLESFTQTGFAMKRARIGLQHKWEQFTGFVFYDAVPNSLVDAYILWQVNERFSVQGGRFLGVGLQAGNLTSPAALDLVDYPVMAKSWSALAHGASGRTLGVQLNAKVTDKVKASLLLHNGRDKADDLFLITNTPLTALQGDTLLVYRHVETGFVPKVDIGLYATPVEGVDLGFTYGIPNEFRPQASGEYVTSLTAFAYYKTATYRAKVDFMRLDSKDTTWDDEDDDYTAQGYALTGAYSINPKLEIAGRYDFSDGNTDVDDNAQSNITVGLNYSFNPDKPYDHRLQANYIRRLDETIAGMDIPDPNIFQLQWQVFIH